MVYDSNGFNFQGNSILENFDNTYPGGNTSGFQKDGDDIGTLVTCVGSYSGREDFRNTNLNLGYTTVISNNVVDIDEIFCTEKPVPTITISKKTDDEPYSNPGYSVKRDYHTDDTGVARTRFQFFAHTYYYFPSDKSQSWSQYYLNISDVGATCPVRVIVCGGGGAGGERPNGSYMAGPGGGGGGEVKFIGGHLLEGGTYTIQVGSGGKWTMNGISSWIEGPSITGTLEAKGGGRGGGGPYNDDGVGGTINNDGFDGGSGGGSQNGGPAGSYVSGSVGGLTNVVSYGNNGGGSNNDGGGGGGGGSHPLWGWGGSGSGHAPGSGGPYTTIDGLNLGGGGSGRSRYSNSYHGTDYGGNDTGGTIVYGGGGRGDENSTMTGIVTLAFQAENAIDGTTVNGGWVSL